MIVVLLTDTKILRQAEGYPGAWLICIPNVDIEGM